VVRARFTYLLGVVVLKAFPFPVGFVQATPPHLSTFELEPGNNKTKYQEISPLSPQKRQKDTRKEKKPELKGNSIDKQKQKTSQ
jgi:hypothetical protein